MNQPDRPGAQPPAGRSERLLADDQLPATVGQVKSLRRWLIVAGVWAVAATALAVFALIQANQEDEAGREEAAGELGRVQRQLNNRIDDLEQRIEGLPSSEDISNLEDRLGQVEDDASRRSPGRRAARQPTRRPRGPRRPAGAERRPTRDGTETETAP